MVIFLNRSKASKASIHSPFNREHHLSCYQEISLLHICIGHINLVCQQPGPRAGYKRKTDTDHFGKATMQARSTSTRKRSICLVSRHSGSCCGASDRLASPLRCTQHRQIFFSRALQIELDQFYLDLIYDARYLHVRTDAKKDMLALSSLECRNISNKRDSPIPRRSPICLADWLDLAAAAPSARIVARMHTS